MRQFIVALCATSIIPLAPYMVQAQPHASGAQIRAGHKVAADAGVPVVKPTSLKPVASGSPAALTPDQEAMKLFKPVSDLASDWLKRPELYHSLVGLEIMDIPSGRVLFSSNGNKRFVTASIAKVLTTACAYETVGGTFRYRTSLVGFGEVKNARLDGSLMLIPSEDPSLERKDVHQLLQGLRTQGIKFVSGRVLLQQIAGGGDHFATEWVVQDWGQDWMPPSSDLVVDRNILGGDPGGGYPTTIATAATETSALTHSLLKAPWGAAWATYNKTTNSVTSFRPDIPVNGGIVVGNPSEYHLAMVRNWLKGADIKVDGHDLPPQPTNTVLATHASEPLTEIIRFCLKKSDNLYAQQLLRTVGGLPVLSRNLEKASLEDRGLARLHAWLSGIGVPASEVVIWDGCGLSRKNAITPHAFNLVLRHMAGPTGSGPYLDLMTHTGEGNVRTWNYKTGAMDSVRSITGVIRTSTGQPMAVTAIVNDHQPQIGELRTSLGNLVGRLHALGGIKLTAVSTQSSKRSAGNRASSTSVRPRRRSRRH